MRAMKIVADNKPINPRTLKFITAYLEHGNATLAVKQAGYASKHAHRYAPQLLNTKRVKQALERLKIDQVSKGFVLGKYKEIVQRTTNNDANSLDMRVAIEGLKGISAIQGFNAPIKTQSENLNISGTLEDIRSILGQYQQDE